MKWRTTGYQDPEEGEMVLIIDPKTSVVRVSYFSEDIFFVTNDYEFNEATEKVKWWHRLDDIKKDGLTRGIKRMRLTTDVKPVS